MPRTEDLFTHGTVGMSSELRGADRAPQREVDGEEADCFVPVLGSEGEVQGRSGSLNYGVICGAGVRELREQGADARRE